MLFHKEIFIPQDYLSKAEYFVKSFNKYPYVLSKHLQERYELDRSHGYDNGITKILDKLSSLDGYIFEIEVENNKVIKYCIRVKFDESQDICFAIMPRYKHSLIKTAWLNSNTDAHYTLDKSKYVDEKNYQIALQIMKKVI